MVEFIGRNLCISFSLLFKKMKLEKIHDCCQNILRKKLFVQLKKSPNQFFLNFSDLKYSNRCEQNIFLGSRESPQGVGKEGGWRGGDKKRAYFYTRTAPIENLK